LIAGFRFYLKKMIDFKKISHEIINLLRNQKLYRVLVFGSYAYGKAHDESDIDLLVILDKKGISCNYREILENKKNISVHLRELRKTVPVDLLVYTRDEWTALENSGSSFIRQIEKEGIRLL
jgi:predicted nucleotidyltransferase